jgi:hypothetical protein
MPDPAGKVVDLEAEFDGVLLAGALRRFHLNPIGDLCRNCMKPESGIPRCEFDPILRTSLHRKLNVPS